MVETSDAVRRDIEVRRRRMAVARARIDRRFNIGRYIRDHPWPAVGIAFGVGVVLARSLRAPSARAPLARKLPAQIGVALDDVLSHGLRALSEVAKARIDHVRERMREAAAPSAEGYR